MSGSSTYTLYVELPLHEPHTPPLTSPIFPQHFGAATLLAVVIAFASGAIFLIISIVMFMRRLSGRLWSFPLWRRLPAEDTAHRWRMGEESYRSDHLAEA